MTGSERSAELPDVPSMEEAGLAEVNTGLWSGMFVPARPLRRSSRSSKRRCARVIVDPDVNAKLKAMAVAPGGGPVG